MYFGFTKNLVSYKNWKKTNKYFYLNKYKKLLKKSYLARVRRNKETFERTVIESKCSRKFFNYFRYILKQGSKDISILDKTGQIVTNYKTLSNNFNDYFLSVFSKHEPIPSSKRSCVFSKILISESSVRTAIKSINGTTGRGFDKIPIMFWKLTIDSIVKPLTKLFNISSNVAYIPPIWKISVVYPLYKKYDASIGGAWGKKLLRLKLCNFTINNL